MSSSEENLRDGFKGISDALETDFEMETVKDSEVTVHSENVEIVEVTEADGTKSEVMKVQSEELPIINKNDEEYIDLELKETINGVATVMQTLEDDLKVGAEARKFEVYATLASAKVGAINSFRDLKLAKKKIHLEDKKVDIRSKQQTSKLENNGTVNNVQVQTFTTSDLKAMTKDVLSGLNKDDK